MEIVEKEGVKVPNSLIVSGLCDTPADEEIGDFLKQYGKISCIICIDDVRSEFNGQAIFEFESGALEPMLPLHRASSSNPSITYHVKTLASVYSSKVGTETTHSFLSELKNIAKMSGKPFENILQEELARITKTLAEDTAVVATEAVEEPVIQPQTENALTSPHFARTESPLPQTSDPLVSPGVSENRHSLSLSPDHISNG